MCDDRPYAEKSFSKGEPCNKGIFKDAKHPLMKGNNMSLKSSKTLMSLSYLKLEQIVKLVHIHIKIQHLYGMW